MSKAINVLERLSSELGRRDEEPNIELAGEIAATDNKKAIKELVELLSAKKAIQNDVIKVLYEVGGLKPELIGDYWETILGLLDSKNNRLQWGAMTALSCIVKVRPKEIRENLGVIVHAANIGTVITRDHAMKILAQLASIQEYNEVVLGLMMEQIEKSPVNQLPAYAEYTLPAITENTAEVFIKTLRFRMDDQLTEAKRKRIEKVIKKAGAKA